MGVLRLVRYLTIGALVLLVILYTYAQYIQFPIKYKPTMPVPPLMGDAAKQKWEALVLALKEFRTYCDNFISLAERIPMSQLTEQTDIIHATKPTGISDKISADLEGLRTLKVVPELSDSNDFDAINEYVRKVGDKGVHAQGWHSQSLSDYKTWLTSIDDARYSAEHSMTTQTKTTSRHRWNTGSGAIDGIGDALFGKRYDSKETTTGGVPEDYDNQYYTQGLAQSKVMEGLEEDIQKAGVEMSSKSQSLLLAIISG